MSLLKTKAGFYGIFILLSSAIFSVVFLNDRYDFVSKEGANMPLLELKNFRYDEFSTTVRELTFSGGLGYHFADKDIVKNFKIDRFEHDLNSSLSAKNALLQGSLIGLDGDLRYTRSDGYVLTSQKGVYDKTSSIAKITTPFEVAGEKIVVRGSGCDVDIKNKRLAATDIAAKVNY